MKRFFTLLLTLVLLPLLALALFTGSGRDRQAAAYSLNSHSGVLSLPDPTIQQIYAAHDTYQVPTNRFTTQPSVTAPYATGTVDPNYMQQVENYLNFYRYVAKVPAVEMDEDMSLIAQYGAVVTAANKVLTHYPAKPNGMSDSFYTFGKQGAGRSNISAYSFASKINQGWTAAQIEEYRTLHMLPYSLLFMLRDYDINNYLEVGHRRYILSPYLINVGFGMADSADNTMSYYLVNIANSDNPLLMNLNYDVDFDYMAWPPSGNCPNSLMAKTYPWSISLNEARVPVPAIKDENGKDTVVGDRTGIVITVTRYADGKQWVFDDQSPDGTEAGFNYRGYDAAYFVVDKHADGFGPLKRTPTGEHSYMVEFSSNALIFRPDFEDDSPLEGIYQVSVTGLYDKDGLPVDLSYEVNFFNFDPCGHEWSDWEVTAYPNCTLAGYQTRSCNKCGEFETEAIAPLGHNWGSFTQIQNPSCTEGGIYRRVCQRCGAEDIEETNPLGHNWGIWIVTQDPDCTNPGSHYHTCARCPEEEVEEIPALGHNWNDGAVLTAPTCTTPGILRQTCQRCATTSNNVIPALGHDWNDGEVLSLPSCTRPGVVRVTCQRCHQTSDSQLPALGHSWGPPVVTKEPGVYEPGERTYTCANCGETYTEVIEALNAPNPFVDVKRTDSYFQPVLWAYYHQPEQVTAGMDATHFGPDLTVTRGQAMVFFWAAQGKPEPRTTKSPFKDVKKSHYFYKAVLWAVENNITAGTDATHFSPNKTCNRSEILQFFYASVGKPAYTSNNPYSDVKNKHWYKDGAIWAYELGLERGEGGKFKATTPCTRASTVTYLFRFLTRQQLVE